MKYLFALTWALLAGVFSFQQIGHTQTTSTSGQSEYFFRFNTSISSVFLSSMTFPQQQSINLGTCTATEHINGPLICAVNCSNQSVCLLDLTGPSGASVNDVMEKVSETPISSSATASPTPTASAIPGLYQGSMMIFRESTDRASNLRQRVDAYNSVK